jgi:hypothetical protein
MDNPLLGVEACGEIFHLEEVIRGGPGFIIGHVAPLGIIGYTRD